MVGYDLLFSKPFAQIDHRHNFSPQVNDPLDVFRRIRHGSNFREADDFMERGNRDSIGLAPHLKTDNVQLAVHENFLSLRM